MTIHIQMIDPNIYVNDMHNHKIAKTFLSFKYQNVKRNLFVEITSLMNESINNGSILCPNLIVQYYEVMLVMPQYISCPSKLIVEFTNKLFKLNMINAKMLTHILMMRELDECYKFFTHINYDHVCHIVDKLNCECPSQCHVFIAIDMIKNVVLDDGILLKLLECKNQLIMSSLIKKLKSINVTLSQDHLSVACDSLPYSTNMVTYLLTNNLMLTSDNARHIFEKCDCDFLLSILEQTRLIIDKNIFQGVVMSNCGKINKKLNICVHAGYIPDVDDVIIGIKYEIEIPHIERFDLELDMGVFGLCCERSFFPNYTFVGIDDTMIKLAKYCDSNNMSGVKKILKSGYVPSVEFMDIIVKTGVRKSILHALANAGGKLSLDGLKNKFDEYDYKLIVGCVNDICGDVKKKDEIIMLLSGKCDCKIEYDIDKFKDVICVGKYFNVDSDVTFNDAKMLLWNKICKNSWVVGKYIVIPDTDVSIFSGHKYVKICDVDQLVCAYINCNHV